jgi:SAM-dependent methyltransferase
VSYQGLELSTKAVELAKANGVNVANENITDHANNHENYYDIVCLFQVLEHLTEIDTVMKAIYKTLKKGGVFVIAVPDNDGFISHTPNYTFNFPPHHTIWWSESTLRHLASMYSFDVIEVQRELLQEVHRFSSYQSYIVNFLKRLLFIRHRYIDRSRTHNFLTTNIGRLLEKRKIKRIVYPVLQRRQKFGQSILVALRK